MFLEEINKQVLEFLNNLISIDFIKQLVFIFADAPIFFLPVFLLAMWIWYSHHKSMKKNQEKWKKSILLIFYSIIIAIIINIIVQQFFTDIKRPELFIKNKDTLILNHVPDTSFPSDHAAVSIAFLIWLFTFGYKKIGYFFLPFAMLMNLSRMTAWLHWLNDIVIWSILWWIWVFIIYQIRYSKTVSKLNKFFIAIASFLRL